MEVEHLFDVSGKTALVTGGSGGIGYMIAEGLARAGVKVWICSRKHAEINIAAERLSSFGQVSAIAADLATESGIEIVADKIMQAGALNILINNAGTTWGGPIETFPRAGFEKVLDLNLLAPFALTKALLPSLRAAASQADPARIINIASIDGIRVPIWESYPYSASKAGLIHLTRHLAKFLASENISVNAICPGFFPSKMTRTMANLESPEEMAEIASPLGKRIGEPEDIAAGVIFLSSRAGAWLTGVMIPISGGVGTID